MNFPGIEASSFIMFFLIEKILKTLRISSTFFIYYLWPSSNWFSNWAIFYLIQNKQLWVKNKNSHLLTHLIKLFNHVSSPKTLTVATVKESTLPTWLTFLISNPSNIHIGNNIGNNMKIYKQNCFDL